MDIPVIQVTSFAIFPSEDLQRILNKDQPHLNFQGSYAGNAAGFRLKDLCKLVELRTSSTGNSNDPQNGHLSLLDFVVKTAQETNSDALTFVEEFAGIEQANRLDIDYVRKTVAGFEANIRNVKGLLASRTNPSFKEQIGDFIRVSPG